MPSLENSEVKVLLFQTIRSEVVSHLSYVIGSSNEAVVIDPRRDCHVYVETAKKWAAQIKYIFETHRNEDYVIGSIELSHMTGARIVHGPGLEWEYGETSSDGQEFGFGSLSIRALHTPGHSPESMSYALYDSESGDRAIAVFTGDTLFVGDTGRTDFLGPEMTPVMAAKMYDSIKQRLLPLGDGAILFPAHGAGSVCGGKIGEREISTLGLERQTNEMLSLGKEDFVAAKCGEHHESPPYFKRMESYNLRGPPAQSSLPNPMALKPTEFRNQAEARSQIVDMRSAAQFGAAHVEGSYSLTPSRLSNAGWVLDYDRPILLVVNDNIALDFATRNLFRLGFDSIKGYLAGGMDAWCNEGLPIGQLELITVQRLKRRLESKEDITIVDVRRQNEWDDGHIGGSMHIYLGRLPTRIEEIPKNRPITVICKTGNRSSFGASVLLRAGFEDVQNCLGGIDAWRRSGYPLEKS